MKKSTTDKLLDMAADMLSKAPAVEFKITELAERSGMTRANIYNLFAGGATNAIKAAVLDRVVCRSAQMSALVLETIDPGRSSPVEKLLAALRGIRSGFEHLPTESLVAFRHIPRSSRDELFEASLAILKSQIKEMRSNKDLSDSVRHMTDAEVASIVFSMTWDFLERHFTTEPHPPMAKSEADFVSHLNAYIVAENAKGLVEETIVALRKQIRR